MAKPIALIPKPQVQSEEARQALNDASLEYAPALLSSLKTLQALDGCGALDLLTGLAGASDHLIGQLSSGLNSPEAIRGIRNLLILARLLGNIDPEWLNAAASSAGEAAEKTPPGKPPSLWKILRKARSEDSRRALNAAVEALAAVGKGLGREASQPPKSS